MRTVCVLGVGLLLAAWTADLRGAEQRIGDAGVVLDESKLDPEWP
jgi:hypothetical protein